MKMNQDEYIEYIEKKKPTLEKNNPDSKWFLIQTQSNVEKKARKNIACKIVLENLQDKVEQILIPLYNEKTKGIGKKEKIKEKRIYGNYIFMLAQMDEKLYQAIKGAEKVSGFVQGASGKSNGFLPTPISEIEMKAVFKSISDHEEGVINKNKFNVGDTIRILTGPFSDNEGTIKEIKDNMIKVSIFMLGRETDMNFNSKEIEKLEN
tara:strand:- start:104 stop:724 length:621 start_codon:yes stop_codon:yes gene_type:complete